MDAVSAKRFRLAQVGRRSYASQSAKATLCRELAELQDGLPAGKGRNSFRRARKEVARASTPFGPVVVDMTLELRGGQTHTFAVASPMALLYSTLQSCSSFRAFFYDRLRAAPCNAGAPWGFLLYLDEVSPGAELKHHNLREVFGIYWSIKEFGERALACEDLWFPFSVALTCVVKELEGGISRFVGELLVRFLFNDAAIHVLAAGALLQFNNPLNPGVQVCVLMFLEWAFCVADCEALQQLLLWRGASATQMCYFCKNTVSARSDIAHRGGSNYFVDLSHAVFADFDLHSDASVFECFDDLVANAPPVLSATRFDAIQQ